MTVGRERHFFLLSLKKHTPCVVCLPFTVMLYSAILYHPCNFDSKSMQCCVSLMALKPLRSSVILSVHSSQRALHYFGVSVSYFQRCCLSDQFSLLPTLLQSLHSLLFHCSIFNRIEQMAASINQACLGHLVLKI